VIPKDGLNPQYFLAAFRRRFWYVVIPVFLASMATVIYCIMAPRLYQSNSLILIQPQEVPTDYVKPTVTSDIQFRLDAITDEIMSRSNLEEIIKRFDLFQEERTTATLTEAIEEMREKIKVNLKKSRRRGSLTSFEVSFEYDDAKKAKEVTAALTALFLDHNFRLRQEQAVGTSKFLERELTKMKEELRQWEDKVRQFKEKYVGLLPEQMENSYRILSQLQQQLDSLNSVLQKTEDRKIMLQSRLSRLESLQDESAVSGMSGIGSADNQRPQNLEELRRQLQTLRSRYSDRHPDVIRLAGTIAKMEREQEANTQTTASETPEDSHVNARQSGGFVDVQYEELSVELKMIDKEIISLRQEIEETNNEIEKYRHRIETGPKIEAMFVDLRRGYEQASSNYQSLLQKKLQADLAENLERTQKGEQFKILDPANLPREPFKPDIPKLLAMGFIIALACGFGMAFLREYLDPTFWSRKELESALEVPVLVSIPVILTHRERRRKKLKLAATVCVLLAMSSTLLYALFVLWRKNPTLLPL